MSVMTKALGIDFGERRIGLAVSDPEGRYAVPLTVIERQTDRRAAYEIAAIARREEAERLVLGDPLKPDGNATENAERVRRFGERLAKASGLPVERIDETLTTVEAAERAGIDPSRPGKVPIDALAAQVILQRALDQTPNEATE